MRKQLYFIATVVLAISCSSPAEKAAVADEQAYSPAHIQSLAQTDYEAAMKLTEEALRKGGMSLFTASTLRANITYQFTEDYDVAAAYMRKALDLDEAKDPGTRSELLYHLVTILRNSRDFTALLSACTEGKECAHRAGKVFEEYSFDFLAGNCLYDLGEDETGFEMMHSALSAAGKTAATEAEFGHLLYFTSQYINSLRGDKNYQGALTACTAYEGFIDRMERSFPDVDPAYIDRCRFYLDIGRSICKSYLGEPSAAAASFKSALERSYAATTGGKSFLVDYYAASAQPDKILELYQNDLPFTDADTVSRAYRLRIARLKEAFVNAGDQEKARQYQAIYDSLSRKIEAKEQTEGTLVDAAKYDTQRYRYKLEDTTIALNKNQWLILALIVVFVIAFAVLLPLALRKSRQHSKETRLLEKSLSSVQRQVSIIAEKEFNKRPSDQREEQLSLKELIEGQKLYLNKNLNRQGAANLMGQEHEIPIAELADRCGFYTIRTFQRSFLAVTGKSPSEFIKEQKTNNSE